MIRLTLLERLDLVIEVLFSLFALAQLLDLDLFSKLLQAALFLGRLASFDARRLVEQLLSDLLHVVVGFKHFGVIVVRTGEGHIGGLEQLVRVLGRPQGLLVAERGLRREPKTRQTVSLTQHVEL